MAREASTYRFGDLLALARRSWVLSMAHELESRGYGYYRVSDAASMRLLLAGQLNIARLASALGVTRQAARKVIKGLEERSLAVTRTDIDDSRKLEVLPTPAGAAYAGAVIEVIATLNADLVARVSNSTLSGADRALRAVIADPALAASAGRIEPPPVPGRRGATPCNSGGAPAGPRRSPSTGRRCTVRPAPGPAPP